MKSQDNQKCYWTNLLKEDIPPLDIPKDFNRYSKEEGNLSYSSVYRNVKLTTMGSIKKLSKQEGITESAVYLTAFMILLMNYTRQEDMLLGINIDSPEYSCNNDAITTDNALFLRGKPERTKTSITLLEEIQKAIEEAGENKNYPPLQLREELRSEGIDLQPYLSITAMVSDRLTAEEVLLEEKEKAVSLKEHDTEALLSFHYAIQKDSVKVIVTYNTSFYKKETAERILLQYLTLLECLSNAPNVCIGELETAHKLEQEAILYQFNNTAMEYPDEKTVVELFEEQVRRTPDKTAVVFEKEKLTYSQFNAKANALGYELRKLGIKPGDFVAILAERSLEMLIGVYGIIKAGGVYVPMDVNAPKDRLAYMFRDCNPKVIVTCQWESTPGIIPAGIPVMELSRHRSFRDKADNLPHVNQPDDLLYCIYTSGTTGRPKGVLIRNSSMVNLSCSLPAGMLQAALAKGYSNMACLGNLFFDICKTEIIGTLLNGMTAVIANREEQEQGEAFENYVLRNNIEIVQTTPSRMKLYLEENKHTEYLKQVKLILLGGENVASELIQRLQTITSATIENVYGPTETTVWSTCDYVKDTITAEGVIGKPIGNTQIYVLNGNKLCGIGIPGELCIAGNGLARGYLNRPDLTEEKFIENPFGEGKLYRTGDLAKWLPDGRLQYLGRMDDQVKVRGFRIELGEVETALKSLEDITDAAVIVREDESGENAIYAYMTAAGSINFAWVREELEKVLPAYMVPSYFMCLNKLPVNRNGKLDRRALPQIEGEDNSEYAAPGNQTEEMLCNIFQDKLKVKRVGVNSNFYELGGDSIKAIRIVGAIRNFGYTLDTGDILSQKTVKNLAGLLQQQRPVKNESKAEESEVILRKRGSRDEAYPLTSIQEGMLFHSVTAKEEGAYILQLMVNNTDSLDINRFEQALELLTLRYEVLRTAFFYKNTKIPVQVVEKERKCEFQVLDIANSKDIAYEIEQIRERDYCRGFDLEKEPLLRVTALHKGDGKYECIFSIHHIIIDGWSIALLLNTFSEYYHRLISGTTQEEIKAEQQALTMTEANFGDYIQWVKKREIAPAKEYFKNLLEDYENVAAFMPSVAKTTDRRQFKLLRYKTGLDWEKLLHFARNMEVTGNTLVETALGLVLQKYCFLEDVVFGKVVSGREAPIPNIESIAGIFINTVPQRIKRTEGMKLKTLLENVQKQSIDSSKYDYLGLAEINDLSLVSNDLVKVLFVFENYDGKNEPFKGESKTGVFTITDERESTNYDITLSAYEEGAGFCFAISYNENLYDEMYIMGILKKLELILQWMPEAAESKLEELELISEDEKQRILYQFNDTDFCYDTGKTVVELFEEQADKTPGHTAVVSSDTALTYQGLNARANRVANQLRAYGIGREDLVAILTEKTVDVIAVILGILKAGGAYVPIDPDYPLERIHSICDNCRPKAVIMGEELLFENFRNEYRVLTMNSLLDSKEEETNPIHVNQAGDLLYILYTSGTTGNPKGVMVEHKGIVNLREYFSKSMKVNDRDSILQFAKFTFDGSVWEMSMALLNGAKLVLCSEEERLDQDKFMALVQKEKVSIAALPPAFYHMLTDFSPRIVITAGSEAIRGSVEKAVRTSTYINSYGPTECSVAVTDWRCDRKDCLPDKIPIGKPILNTKVYIMEKDKLCGIGIPGELCVAGNGVARGYYGNEELTKEKFVKNPFGKGYLYRTGDLARWNQEGNLEYLGRMDKQVKIRGFRIELAEIEEALRQIAAVKDCAVTVREDEVQEKYICAYVASQESALKIQELKEELRRRLPGYMLPSYIVELERIPVNDNGKLDIKSLPKIEFAADERERPENEMEHLVEEAFEEVLCKKQLSVLQSFFDLGGHSLKAMRLVNAIEAKTGIRIPVKSIFRERTIRNIAACLLEAEKERENEIIPAGKKEHYPMSGVQKRLFLLEEMADMGIAYNMPRIFRLSGELEKERLTWAFQQLINRHEALRTVFLCVEGEFVQKIADNVLAELQYNTGTEDTLRKDYESFIKPFSLNKVPLMRLLILKTEAYSYLCLDMHHIISDGMSMAIVMEELIQFYNQMELKPLTLHYKDYSEWFKEKDISKQREYWLQEFAGEVPVLNMPLDFNRPQKQSFKGNSIRKPMGSALTREIKEFAVKTKTTEYMVLLSALFITLSKYSCQQEIAVGTVVSGRGNQAAEKMLGMFVNTLVMKATFKEEMNYIAFLQQVKETALNAYENQEYPFDELVNAIGAERDISRNPLFDVVFAFQNNEDFQGKLEGMEIKEITDFIPPVAKFDLTFNIDNVAAEYVLSLEYSIDLWREETICRLEEHFKEIVKFILAKPDSLIKDIPMITAKERIQIQNNFNNTKTPYERNKTVAALFEEQVQKNPHKGAVVYEDETLTYHQLNAKANRIALTLREKGVQREDCVAILAKKGTPMIAGILGIIKAGAAYVPIDPSYPEERIAYLIEDCQAKAVLYYQTGFYDIQVPVINLEEEILKAGEVDNPVIINEPEDLIYIIYTSGTTGKPKGVMIEHRSVVRLVKHVDYVPLEEETVILQTGQISFDASTFEIWGALLNGGTLCLAEQEKLVDYKELAALIEKQNVNTLWLTSSLFNQIFTGNNHIFDRIKYLLTGGEKLSESHVRAFKEKNLTTSLINCYGPTEGTTFTTTYRIPDTFDTLWIGKPISNTEVYILQDTSLCGIDVPGELCIAGDGIARGYLNQEEATSQKFIKNPFGPGLLYRSGDLARWRSDGNLEYLGRMDSQVKIRGFRIEPDEIKTVLGKLQGINDCAVVVRTDERQDKALYAYLCSETLLDMESVKNELEKVLPHYMIPSYFHQIDKIPVTKNGKFDVGALPVLTPMLQEAYIEPANEMERLICHIFSEILGLDQVSAAADFFRIGGHSLRVVQVINRIEEETGVRLSIKRVFEEKTAQALAKCIQSERMERRRKEYSSIPVAEYKEYYPMSSAQKRIYLIQQTDEEGTAYNMPVCYKVTGDLKEASVKAALQEMVKRHEVLRTRLFLENGELLQQVLQEGGMDYTSEITGNSLEEVVNEFVKPFDLEHGQVLRMKLAKNPEGTFLLIDMHHAVSDGMSMDIWWKEFRKLYNRELLSPVKRQYKDYSEWMAARELTRQKDYWVKEFEDEIPVMELPYDYRRGKIRNYQGDVVKDFYPVELAAAIQQLCQKAGITEYILMLSACMITMAKYSGQEDIVIGSPISGRTHKDTEDMLGMFVNTLAMRGFPNGNKTVLAFLMEMKEKCLKAYENQDYPFEELVKEIGGNRDNTRNPLFDVMFSLQSTESVEITLEESKLTLVETGHPISKFDLTIEVSKTKDVFLVTAEYGTTLFKKETIAGILKHYQDIIKQICENPEKKISELDLVTKEEENIIRYQFNNMKASYPRDKTIVELFETQVLETPDKTALIYGEDTLSYLELNRKANKVAHCLRKEGVKPEDFVAIIAGRSLEMVVGIYGVIKSGAAYVPMDPTYPKERLRFMIEDCKPKVLLIYLEESNTDAQVANSAIEEIITEHNWLKVINLGKESKVWRQDEYNPVRINSSDNLAYVIYTSGTTGKPKGVMIEHKSLINLVLGFEKIYKITKEDILLQFASFSFDQSVWEIFQIILLGGTLCMIRDRLYEEKENFLGYIQEKKVSIAGFTPAFLAEFHPEDFKTLRLLQAGGAELREDVLEKWLGKVEIVNAYGPTENTVITSTYNCSLHRPSIRVPIGKPDYNVEVYILAGDKLCPVGMPGELCIAGDGLARGYLNRPELTREKFIRNPFGEGKLYRTGDLAKWLADGNIDYLGRIDEQIKIRGFRIELGEIESVIRKIEGIKDCAVIAKRDHSGDLALYAFITAALNIDIGLLRRDISEFLPGYMIPGFILQIDAIPVTANGKLDKRKLTQIPIEKSKGYTEPKTEEERVICSTYEDILNQKEISTEDTFFELGGDSIKAIRIVSKLREYGYQLKIRDILNNLSIAKLAKLAEKASQPEYNQDEVSGMVAYTPIMMYFKKLALAKPEYYNQSVIIEIQQLNKTALKAAIKALVIHHDMLRAVYNEKGLFIRSCDAPNLYEYYEYILPELNEEKKDFIIAKSQYIQSTINLSEGALIKTVLYEEKDKAYLQFILHHLVVDAVSFRILLEDFETAYLLAEKEAKIQLPKKTLSYKQWSELLLEYAKKEVNEDRVYWDKVLEELPSGLIQGQIQGRTEYECISLQWSREITNQLIKSFIPKNKVSINTVLLTAFVMAVHKMTKQDKVAVELEGHGREGILEDKIIDRTVGWFTSIHPILLPVCKDLVETFYSTRRIVENVPKKGVTYNILKYLTDASYEETIDISFNYHGSFSEGGKDTRINLSEMQVGRTIAEENICYRSMDLNGLIEQEKLKFEVRYNKGKYRKEFMEGICANFKNTLEDIASMTASLAMEEEKITLPVVLQEDIKVYLHRSLPLCIILAYENYKEWYYSNYIQIFSQQEEVGLTELNYMEPRDSYADIAEVICLGFPLFREEEDFITFTRERLKQGYYLIANVDEAELRNKHSYKQEHYIHPSLIYGYDDEKKQLKGIGFEESRIFTYLEYDYEEMQQAFINGRKYYKLGAPWCEWSAVQLIKPKTPEKKYLFDKRKFLRDLHDYVYSVADNQRLYTFGYEHENTAYGLQTYEVVIERLQHRLQKEEFVIDYRAIHLMYEHRKGLYQRISYAAEKYKVSKSITRELAKLQELVEAMNKVRVRWFPIDYKDGYEDSGHKVVLQKLIEELQSLKEQELSVVTNLYELLAQELND
ncbi:amino acid adenylation domain-containing protein [Anaerocolumna sp. AGMB13020]|uniref:non-ribosomal peptide synthetase n=1 Tax=Anaerocolumna sp. AGMB13020 TaxID=3081750 RepID=UPI002954B2F6|nr:non-ribosomal peptide synthetase [Anaerocolumna sp. AGMB13020]WOO36403.1 amino acid adenylation domain-containing protein [Anaerocolumna sp. AGMB13020]